MMADLFLDTFPYNAHTTCVDSLKGGVPLISKIGNSFASRVSSSILNAIGLQELITENNSAYEALAIDLATNPEKLNEIKLKLKRNIDASPLFNSVMFTQHLELGFEKVIGRYHQNLEPDHIVI
jgi:predicted O-linked N-acetylglucosamine transferase (SPINDLY family)